MVIPLFKSETVSYGKRRVTFIVAQAPLMHTLKRALRPHGTPHLLAHALLVMMKHKVGPRSVA